MPRIYNWAGNQQSLSFDQLRCDLFHFPPSYLIDLFGTLMHNSKTPIFANENIGFAQEQEEE
jgi:hypothetical protein